MTTLVDRIRAQHGLEPAPPIPEDTWREEYRRTGQVRRPTLDWDAINDAVYGAAERGAAALNIAGTAFMEGIPALVGAGAALGDVAGGGRFDPEYRARQVPMLGALSRIAQRARAQGEAVGLDPRLALIAEFGGGGLEDVAFSAAAPAFRALTKADRPQPQLTETRYLGYGAEKRRPSAAQQAEREEALKIVRSRMAQAREQMESAEFEGDVWYNMMPEYERLRSEHAMTHDEAVAELESLAARGGATSPGTKVPKNIERALWAHSQATAGVDITKLDPTQAGAMGRMGGKTYYGGMLPSLRRIQEAEYTGQGALDAITSEKTRPFAGALAGDYGTNPVDMHEMRFWYGQYEPQYGYMRGPDTGLLDEKGERIFREAPTAAQRWALEQVYTELAEEYGITRAQAMARRWVGGAKATNIEDPRPWSEIMNDQLAMLGEKLGLDPGEVFDRVIRGEMPIGLVNLGKDNPIQLASAVTPQEFVKARDAARIKLGNKAPFLSPTSARTFLDEGTQTLLTADGLAGFALRQEDKDIQNLFNVGAKGTGGRLIDQAVALGGRRLDAFRGFLTKLYKHKNFEEYAADAFSDQWVPEGWDFEAFGRPDVVYMRLRE